MQKTKLTQLLLTLKEEEIKAFGKFLQSPYFNNSLYIERYWEQLKRQLPTIDPSQFSPQKLFKKIFPKEEYQEKKLRQLRSRLLKLLEEFLAIEQFKKDEFEFKKRVADVYLEKELKREFEKKYHLLLKNLEKEDFLTDQELHQKLSLYHQLYFNPLHPKKDDYPHYLAASVTLLEKYYERHKQLYALEWFSMQERYNHPLPPLLRSYKDYLLHKEIYSSNQLEIIYKHIILLFITPKEKEIASYYKCKDLLATNYQQLPIKEKNIFLKSLINFCISRFRESNQTNQELFFLYSLGLSDNSIFYKGKMTNITFFMIITNAVKLQKFDWANDFLKTEKWRLFEDGKEIYVCIAEASILFYMKKFKDCLNILSFVNSTHYSAMDLVRRMLEIRALFECYVQDNTYQKTLMNNLNNLEKFLTRSQILSERKRINYINLLRSLKKVVHWKEMQKSLEELNEIKKQLLNSTTISKMYKDWILFHIGNFENEKGLSKTTQVKV